MSTLKFTRTSQPQGPLVIDYDSSLAKGLVGVFSGGSSLQAISGKAPFSNVNNATLNGKAATFDGSTSYLNSTYPAVALVDACTILAVVTPIAYPAVSICTPFVSFETVNQTRGSRVLGITATGGLSLGSMGSNGFGAMISGGTLPIGVPSVVIGSTPDGLVGKAWLNGANVLSGTINTDNGLYGNGTPNQVLTVGRGFGVTALSGSYGYFQGGVQLALVFNRVISDAEVKALSENPWQIFAPISRSIWVPVTEASTTPASGGLTTIESGSDTATFAGTTGSDVQGSLATSETGSDIAAFAGNAPVAASLASTESGSDVAVFSASALVAATLSATESGSDVAVFSASALVSASLASTESGSDTLAFSGNSSTTATLAAVEAGLDSASLTGVTLVSGSLTATESNSDTAAFTAVALAQGSITASETGADTSAFNGGSSSIAILAAVEIGSDTATITGVTLVQASLSALESGNGSASFTGTVAVSGSLSAVETGTDTAAFNAGSSAVANLAATEAGSDSAGFTGLALIQGLFAAAESAADSAALSGVVKVVGSLAATEAGSDTAYMLGGNPFVYIPSLRRLVSPSRTSDFTNSPSRTVPTLTSIDRSVGLTSASRGILLETSPSRAATLLSPERSEV